MGKKGIEMIQKTKTMRGKIVYTPNYLLEYPFIVTCRVCGDSRGLDAQDFQEAKREAARHGYILTDNGVRVCGGCRAVRDG
jgi:hypothetical protein